MTLSTITSKRSLLLLLLGMPFVYGGFELYSKFPGTYTWSELVINYQGGFVRRGLIGEISYQLNGIIQAKYFFSTLSVILYLLVIWAIISREKIINFNVLLFLFSPATILFPVFDINVFARKDVFILAAFVLCIYLSEHIRHQFTALLLAIIIYGFVGLIIETAWFYLPIACSVIILNRNELTIEKQTKAWSISFFFLVGCFIFISLLNISTVSKNAIVDSWRLLYPSYQWDWNGMGAISLLGLPLNDGLLITFSSVGYRSTLKGYLYSFLLASIPTFYLMLNCKFRSLNKSSSLGITWAFSVMLCSFAFAADWGRCIYLFTIHSFLFLTVIVNYPVQTDNGRRTEGRTITVTVLKTIFLCVYATSWQLQHWVLGGQSALRPGPLLVAFQKLVAGSCFYWRL